jgi:hypothetical protein
VIAALLLQYPLANRKALLTSAILVAAAVYVHRYAGVVPRRQAATRRHLWIAGGALAGAYLVFLALSAPALWRLDRMELTLDAAGRAPHGVRDLERLGDVRALARVYLAMGPLIRTSPSVLAYPAIFPRLRPYYPLDVGLDILGIGRMPDDNYVVYRLLQEFHPRATVSAPFHVVLYSQGGLHVALSGALVIGLGLGLAWAVLLDRLRPGIPASLLASLLTVFAIFLALDSVRNAVIVSYGVAWGVLAVAVVHAADAWLPRRRAARAGDPDG